MLQVFSIKFYAFVYPGATLSLVTPFVAKKFNMLPNVVVEHFSVSTRVCDSLVAKTVYSSCLILSSNIVTLVYLLEHDNVDFDIILGIN